MRIYSLLILLIPIFLISCAGIGENLLQSPKLRVTNVSITNLTLNNQSIVFTLGINNPNPIPIPIRGLRYKLDLNNVEFASGFSENTINIPASGEGEMRLNISGDLISFIQKIEVITEGWIDYQLSGDIALVKSTLRFPYYKTGKLTLNSIF